MLLVNNLFKTQNGFKMFSVLLIIVCMPGLLPAQVLTTTRPSFVEGEVLVKFKKSADNVTQNALISSFGVEKKVHFKLGDSELKKIKLEKGKKIQDVLQELADDPDVEYAQPNFIYYATAFPADASYEQLWGLHNTGQEVDTTSGTSGKDMDLETAWDTITDCSVITVAVIDTGVNYNHPDLNDNMWSDGSGNKGYDFIDDDNDPMDRNGHGTHVAGTIGAEANNDSNMGTVGVCWGANIMAVRVLDTLGSGTTVGVVAGLDYAINNGAQVVNMSLGGTGFDTTFNNKITEAKNNGILVVVAAGNDTVNNDGDTHQYPCDYTQDNIICVAALDQNYNLASYSNWGAVSVDVGAPGTNIMSTWPGTDSTIDSAFDTGWNCNGWSYGNNSSVSGSPLMLYNPGSWYGGEYGNNVDDQAYRTFNIDATVDVVTIEAFAIIDVENGDDFFSGAYNNSAANPFSSGTELFSLTGTTGGFAYPLSAELVDCVGSVSTQCTIGYRLLTDHSEVDYGVGILPFTLKLMDLDSPSYNIIDGTSMATPHVAGLAAMLFAYNPQYTYTEVRNAILAGGDAESALVGKTTTEKAVDAIGSLQYIEKPVALEASIP